MGADVLPDRLQEVRLAEPGAAVDQERVVRLAGRLGDGERRRVREPVGRADDERLERVLREEAGPALGRGRPLGCSPLGCDAWLFARFEGLCRAIVADDREAHLEPLARLARRLADQLAEVAFDPGARELVRNADLEIVAREADRAGCAEPRREHAVRKVGT